MAYKIDKSKCVGCGTCKATCPMGAISADADGKYVIDPKICVSCGACASVCPMTAIEPAQQVLLSIFLGMYSPIFIPKTVAKCGIKDNTYRELNKGV